MYMGASWADNEKPHVVELHQLDEVSDVAHCEILTPSDNGFPDDVVETKKFSWRTFFRYVGPGWLLSVAYVDPGNLVSDLQAGAYSRYSLIWVLFAATSIGVFLQILSARLGIVTGRQLADLCTSEYPRWASLALWIMIEIAIIGCDVQEVLGSAIAFQILFGFPLWVGCLITVTDTLTFLFLQRYGMKKLEAVFATLLSTMIVCFFMNTAREGFDGIALLEGFEPHVPTYAVTQAVSVVGAVVMPHCFYLHSALVTSAPINRKNPAKVHEANKYFSVEAAIALFISFLINGSVLVVFAEGFFSNQCTSTFANQGVNTGCVPIGSVNEDPYGTCTLTSGAPGECHPVGLLQAGTALEGMLGGFAKVIWAIGLLAAGQSTTMTGTFAGQFVMEGFLNFKMSSWKRVAITRGVALIPSLSIAFYSLSSPQASDTMDEWLNVLQCLIAPFALLPILHLTTSRKIMGDFVNGKPLITLGWVMAFIVFAANVYVVVPNVEAIAKTKAIMAFVIALTAAYIAFLIYLVRTDIVQFFRWIGCKACRAKSIGAPVTDTGN